MPGRTKISRFLMLTMLSVISFFACQRETFEDMTDTGEFGETILNPALTKLNPEVYTNPVWLEPNQVRFDLIGTPASLKTGMMFYYPDSLGIVGVIVEVNQNQSRAFITYDAISIAQGWLSTFIRDTVATIGPSSESWHEAISKKGDTLTWNSLSLSVKNLKTNDLVVVSENGKMFSDNTLVFFS